MGVVVGLDGDGCRDARCTVCAHEPRDATLTFVIGARIFLHCN